MPDALLRPGISGKLAWNHSDHSPCRSMTCCAIEIEAGGVFRGIDVHDQIDRRDRVILAQRVRRTFDAQNGAAAFEFNL